MDKELKERIEEIILKEFTTEMAAQVLADFIQENYVPKEKTSTPPPRIIVKPTDIWMDGL